MIRPRCSIVRCAALAIAAAVSLPPAAHAWTARRPSRSYAGAYRATAGASPTAGQASPGSPAPHTGSADTGVGWHERNTAKRQFQRKTGFPNGRPGYVVDYIVPLRRGGQDTPENMQWLTIEDARARAGVR